MADMSRNINPEFSMWYLEKWTPLGLVGDLVAAMFVFLGEAEMSLIVKVNLFKKDRN